MPFVPLLNIEIMTLEEKDSPLAGNDSSFNLVDFATSPRDKPTVQKVAEPPICEACQKMELQFFDPNCPGCQELLMSPSTSISEIFAVLRQWTPQTQQNLEILVREILKRGAHVNDRDGLTDMTLLQYVAKAGSRGVGDVDEACRMTHLLLDKGADVYIRCHWTKMTALHYSVFFDVAPIVKILLKASKGFDINSPCEQFDNGTPLHIAATNLCLDSAMVLLQNGADTFVKDDLDRIPADCVSDPNAFEPESEMGILVTKIRKLFADVSEKSVPHSPINLEAQQANATLLALGIKVGDRVVVGGMKTGILRFCGGTQFSTGIWAGIELDEAAGKNDGSVGGVNYFKCSHNYGIFAPLSKISRAVGSLLGTPHATSTPIKGVHNLNVATPSPSRVDTSRVTARIDTGLNRSTQSPGSVIVEQLENGERVIVAGHRKGTIRFCGSTEFAPGTWYGVELDRPGGKNDGMVNGQRYFQCKPKHGVFAPPSRLQRYTDLHGSRDSLDSISGVISEKQRRLSAGSSGSQQSLSNTSARKPHSTRPKSSGTVLPSRRAMSAPNGTGELRLQEGISVLCNNELGVVRYLGPVEFGDGTWVGVELRTPKGKNDGSVQNKRYFSSKPNHGLLVRPSKVSVRGINGAKLLGDKKD